jgi:DNA-binding LacI/PurR family transcriptional regulator
MAAEHLIGLGHRRIGHISAPAEHAASRLRRQGVRDAVDAVVVDGDGGVEGGALAVPALLGAGVTGIVAYNDLTAIGALRGLRQAGALVPEDVSVVGFDDIEMAAWTDPPLTTIRQPTDALGQWAVDRLARVLAGDRAAAVERVVLVPELVVRGSTARL